MHRLIAPACAVAGLAVAASCASAAIIEFQANIDGLQETPPVATPGFGTATMFVDDVTGGWTISGSFSGLIGTTNNAHIHGFAAVGSPAGVLRGLTFDIGVTSGNFSGGSSMGLAGGVNAFTAVEIAGLLDELSYVNIHSTFRPGGEIRGQLLVVPAPASAGVLAMAGLLALRRRQR